MIVDRLRLDALRQIELIICDVGRGQIIYILSLLGCELIQFL